LIWHIEISTRDQAAFRQSKLRLTVAIELARAANREYILAFIFLVWAKLTPLTLVREVVCWRISKWKFILPASFVRASRVRGTVGLSVTLAPELVSPSLEAIFTLIAGAAKIEGTSLYARK
jgi:hypothetical protein